MMKKNILIMSPVCHPSVVFRSEVLKYERYPENTYFQEDYRFWINLMHKGYTFGNVSEPLLYFRFSHNTRKKRVHFRKLVNDLRDRKYALKVFTGNKLYGYFLIIMRFLVVFILGANYKTFLKYRNKFRKVSCIIVRI